MHQQEEVPTCGILFMPPYKTTLECKFATDSESQLCYWKKTATLLSVSSVLKLLSGNCTIKKDFGSIRILLNWSVSLYIFDTRKKEMQNVNTIREDKKKSSTIALSLEGFESHKCQEPSALKRTSSQTRSHVFLCTCMESEQEWSGWYAAVHQLWLSY